MVRVGYPEIAEQRRWRLVDDLPGTPWAGTRLLIARPPPGDVPHAVVQYDVAGGARTMVRHLRSTGRERIAMIAGPLDTPGGRYRLEGYRDELGELFDERLVAYGDYGAKSGSIAIAQLLDRAPDLDAVFGASDLMASGALVTQRERGLRVPDDIAVAGFDDSGLAATLDPPLTTMHQPFDRISAEMVTVMLDIIDGAPRRSVTLPADLVVRAST